MSKFSHNADDDDDAADDTRAMTIPRRFLRAKNERTNIFLAGRKWDVIVLISDHCLSIYFAFLESITIKILGCAASAPGVLV